MKTLISALAASTILASTAFADELTRVATVPVGGEITGMYLVGSDLFFNVQHPSDDIPGEFAKASVGVISNADFGAGELAVPTADADKQTVMSSMGAY